MNCKFVVACILCNKLGAFQCERCDETYCSKGCQVIHWPVHRRMCFPMPKLIPLENPKISSYQSPTSSFAATNYSTKWNPEECENVKKSYNGKQNHNQIVSHKKRLFTYLSPSKVSDSFSKRTESSSENVNAFLATTSSFDGISTETKIRQKKWFEEFLFGEVTDVIVQYFTENPTTTCWVIQQKDVDQRNAILKNLNSNRSFNRIETIDIKTGRVYSVQFEGVFHRGIVLHRINSLEVWVRLIDNGRSFRTRINAVRSLNQGPMDLKGLAFEINFETLQNIVVDKVLRVENISYNSDGVIDVKLVEDEEIFTDEDIGSIALPVDVPTEMFCLDQTNIHKGYISACENDARKIESISQISDQISEYCKKKACDQSYCPKLNELCLAYVVREGQWYRSKCVENVMPNTFKLEMIDYGISEEVSSKNIRKMVKDFMEPTIMHQCTIYGVPPRPDRATDQKIYEFFSRNPIFCIKRAILCGGQYIIHVPDLLKSINE